MAKQMTPLPDAKSVRVNPSAEELKRARGEDAERARDALRQPQRPDRGPRTLEGLHLPGPRRPGGQLAAGHLPRGGRPRRQAPGRLHRRPRHDRRRRLHRRRPRLPHPRAPLHRGGQRQHRRHAAAALLRGRRPRRLRARAHRHLHAQPGRRGLPQRPRDRGRPRAGRHAHLQLRLLRRVEEGRAAHVEQARLRPRRAAAARRLQGDPDRRRRQGRPDRRPVGHRQDHHHVHAARTARCRCRTTSWR